MKPSFKDRIAFYDSARTPAVRVADVLAAILRRGLDGGELSGALAALRGAHFRPWPYTLLQWTDNVPDPGPNPYES